MSVKPIYIENELLFSEKEFDVLCDTLKALLDREITHDESLSHFQDKFPLMKDLLELLPPHAREEAMRITREQLEKQVAEARKRVAALLTKLAVLRLESDHARSGEESIVRFVFPNRLVAEEFLLFFEASTRTEYLATADAAQDDSSGHLYVRKLEVDAKTLTVTGKNS